MNRGYLLKQNGKITFVSLILLAIIIYGVFAAIKLLAAEFEENQIEKEVADTLGLIGGSDFKEEDGINAILNILRKNNIVIDEDDEESIDVFFNRKQEMIEFYYRYEVEIDLIFFKKKKIVEVEDEVYAYS